MGLPISFVNALTDHVRAELPANDDSIFEIYVWFIEWLTADPLRLLILFRKASICSMLNVKPMEISWSEIATKFDSITGLTSLWISGETFETIQAATEAKRTGRCEKARQFALRLIPELSFACGLVSQVSRSIKKEEDWEYEIPGTVQAFASCIKEGFDMPSKLAIRLLKPNLTRIECHQLHSQVIASDPPDENADFKSIINGVRNLIG